MASFLKNTFDNLVNNINSTLNNQNSHNRAAPTQATRTNPSSGTPRSGGGGNGGGGGGPSTRSSSTNNSSHHHRPHNQRQSTDRPTRVLRRDIPQYSNQSRAGERPTRPPNPPADRVRAHQGHNNTYTTTSQQQQNQHYHQTRGGSGHTTNNSNMDNNLGQNQASQTTIDKIDIGDVHDPTEINNLSAKQLKVILTRNCIDFKGIFEKEVLREKVMQLWIDCNEKRETRRARHQSQTDTPNRSQYDDSDIEESQACKICMEREINCVLLECGHMLTCVTCGRKLAECPICRQNVTRCVRTFKG